MLNGSKNAEGADPNVVDEAIPVQYAAESSPATKHHQLGRVAAKASGSTLFPGSADTTSVCESAPGHSTMRYPPAQPLAQLVGTTHRIQDLGINSVPPREIAPTRIGAQCAEVVGKGE